MLIASILESDATLNSFTEMSSLEFIPGEQTELVFRLKQSQRLDRLRYVAKSTSLMTVYLPKRDGTIATVAMTAFADDRSIWHTTLQELTTQDIIGGNINFELDLNGDGSVVMKGWIPNGLSLVCTGACQ